METLAVLVIGAVAATSLLLAQVALARRGRPTADAGTGELVFRYSSRFRVGACAVVLGFQVPVAAMVVLQPPRDGREVVCVALAHAMFAALGGALVWDVCRFRLVVGPDGLACRPSWRRCRSIRWSEVAAVSFAGPVGWFEVRSTDGGAIRLPALVGGLNLFLAACERHLTPDQLRPALSAYVFLDRPFPREGSGAGKQRQAEPGAAPDPAG